MKPVRSASNGRDSVDGSPSAVESAPALARLLIRYGVSAASLAPARTTSTSPRCSVWKASATAIVPAAQAPTPAVTGPVTPHLIAALAAAMLPDTSGTYSGPMRLGSCCRLRISSSPSGMPPAPVWIVIAVRGPEMSSRPASVSARSPATSANWAKRPMRRAARFSMYGDRSKSAIGAACRAGRPSYCSPSRRTTPERCSISDDHRASVPMPVGPTMPIPVMATVEWSISLTGAVWRMRRLPAALTPVGALTVGDRCCRQRVRSDPCTVAVVC